MEKDTKQLLRDYMKTKGLRQTEVSTLIGVNPFTLNRWLNTSRAISVAWQIIIERKLK